MSPTGRRILAIALAVVPSLACADGNVTAVVRNGQLFLRGDNADNQIRITTDGAPAGGVTLLPRINTTINGQLVDFLDVPDIPRGIRAGFGGGEDTFGGSELETFPGDLIVDMGGENDTFAITDLVAQRCDFSFGAGHDNIGFDSMSCAELRIRAGGGQDRIHIIGGGVSGEASISMNGGEDSLVLDGTGFAGRLRVTMSSGNGDFLKVENFCSFTGPVYFSGGTGLDDGFADDGTNEYAAPPTVIQFEQ
jgi:hypothetical protein